MISATRLLRRLSAPRWHLARAHLTPDSAALGGRGGPADEEGYESASSGRISSAPTDGGVSGPREYGGRNANVAEQSSSTRSNARANAPARISSSRGPVRPTLVQFGHARAEAALLPKIQSVDELWCQGFSRPTPAATSQHPDRAVRDGDEWVITGQKCGPRWRHPAADWCFVVAAPTPSRARTTPSYLLCPDGSAGVECGPLRQMTGSAEFQRGVLRPTRARRPRTVLGPVARWKVAMGDPRHERGTAFLSQQLSFEQEARALIDTGAQERRRRRTDRARQLAAQLRRPADMKYNACAC